MSLQHAQRARHQTALESASVILSVIQQPHQALVTNEHKEKARKAVDPPPVVQLKVDETRIHDQRRNWIVSPFIFMTVILVNRDPDPVSGEYALVPGNPLLGLTVSSLSRLKDVHNTDGGFFVFGDISCRKTGTFRLQFNLFDQDNESVHFVQSQVSEPFGVVLPKDFHGQKESTPLSRKFSEQGVRLRLRKEQRSIAGRKRSFEGSPIQSSAPSIAPNLLPASQHDRSYPYPPVKRQRSDDYNSTLYFQGNSFSGSMYPYGNTSHSSIAHPYGITNPSPHHAQMDSRFGNSSISHGIPSTDAPLPWSRSVAQAQSYGSNAYMHAIPSTGAGVRNQVLPSRQPQHGQITTLGGPDESFVALAGLQTPSSMTDTARTSTSSQQQNYMPVAPDEPTPGTGYNAAHASFPTHHHDEEDDPQGNFDYRNNVHGQYGPGYAPNIHQSSSGTSFGHVPADRSLGRYSQNQFATTGGAENSYPEAARDSFTSDVPDLSDNNAGLDAAIINRALIPPHSNYHHHSGLESSPAHYKDLPYPTPHHQSPMD